MSETSDTQQSIDQAGDPAGAEATKYDFPCRIADRYRLESACELTTENGERISGNTWNLSTSGVFVQTEARLAEGAVCTMRFAVPEAVSEPLELTTQVVRFAEDGMGLRFLMNESATEAALKQVVTYCKSRGGRVSIPPAGVS